VVVAAIVMFNILELIMEIVPNYPTVSLRKTKGLVVEELVYLATYWLLKLPYPT
jgi:hypothetical protein